MVRDEPVGPFMRLDSPKGWRVGSDGHDMSCPYNRWASWSPTLVCGEDGATRVLHYHVLVLTSVAVPTLACGEDGAPAFSTSTCWCRLALNSSETKVREPRV